MTRLQAGKFGGNGGRICPLPVGGIFGLPRLPAGSLEGASHSASRGVTRASKNCASVALAQFLPLVKCKSHDVRLRRTAGLLLRMVTIFLYRFLWGFASMDLQEDVGVKDSDHIYL